MTARLSMPALMIFSAALDGPGLVGDPDRSEPALADDFEQLVVADLVRRRARAEERGRLGRRGERPAVAVTAGGGGVERGRGLVRRRVRRV
jgi:hypothetical protein